MRVFLLIIVFLSALQLTKANTSIFEYHARPRLTIPTKLHAYQEQLRFKLSQLKHGSESTDLSAGNSAMDIAVINYSSLDQILRYKKFELGVILPTDILTRVNHFLLNESVHTDELNPFLEWDLDVEAIFYHPLTGIYKKIDGYYHREYRENIVTNDWDDIGTDYPFRIRFAPPQNGKWTVTIAIKIKGQATHHSLPLEFNVVESGDPGYVHVFPNKKNLQRGDQMIFPVGHNFFDSDLAHSNAWIGSKLGNNLFRDQNTKASNTLEWSHYLSKIENYFKNGGKYIRTIQAPWLSLIEFEKKGNYYDRLHYAWEQDKLLDLCERYDALMLFNLLIHHTLEEYGTYDLTHWDWGREEKHWLTGENIVNEERPAFCYNDTPGKKPHETFLLEDDLKYHEQRTRYYISRYGYSTKIYEFELLSEPFNVDKHALNNQQPYFIPAEATQQQIDDQQVLFNAIEKYHRRLGSFIKVNMGHTEHLLGVNYTMHVWNPTNSAIRMDQSLYDETIDIVGLNYYAATPNKYIISKSGNNNSFYPSENSRARAIKELQSWANKPIIFSEFGDGDGTYECSDYNSVYIDIMSGGFTGVCGYNMWPGSESNESFLWPATIQAQNHMNSNEVISTLSNESGNWKQGRQHDTKTKELQYYISNNKALSVGYIRNRTYNIHTMRINELCNLDSYFNGLNPFENLVNVTWNDGPRKKQLKITELNSNSNYQIDWYSFKEGTYLGSDKRKTSILKGNLLLRFPELSVTTDTVNPIMWFIVRENNSKTGMLSVNQGTEAFLLNDK